MPEPIPNGFFCRDLIVFNHLRRGGFVSKGFIFEAPDLTNSPVADLNDFQDQLCLLLASLHEHQRLQVQYFCDSDYKGELLRYQQETEKFSNVWTKRARNERFSRYWQAMSERKLRRQRVIFYISRSLENATVSCVHGDLDDLCDRLTAMQHRAADAQPEIERDLPIIVNEWCTTWGDPQHDKVTAIVDRLRGSDVRYFVIDAGWYKTADSDWGSGHGDWIPSAKLFPHGLAATAKAIRERGLIPGLWFEMETVGAQSTAFSLVDHLLKRDGVPVTVRDRRFWDLNDPVAVDILTKKVIDLLESCGFGYLKVDYNETLGLGCDHADSIGEGLRRQILATYKFFDKIRERLPGIIIENCASGGHRHEPSMLARTAMSSFSDAHELPEIPIVAANLHRLMLPRQSQVWAVLHRADSDQRLIYSLAATFLGRMCLSGEIDGLTDAQWQIVLRAQRLYRRAVPAIKNGNTRFFGERGPSWRHPQGWQAVRRTATDQQTMLIVLHTFAGAPKEVAIPLPRGGWKIEEQLGHPAAKSDGQHLRCTIGTDFSASVILLRNSATSSYA